MAKLPTIIELNQSLIKGQITSAELTETALERIEASDSQSVFTKTYAIQSRAAAKASDTLRAAGRSRSPIDGLPVSIKDLFDVAGETTLAGSVVLRTAPKAKQNAVIVQRLIDAGAVIIGRTNMTEFAFSGLGLNPHYGTPSSPWDRASERIPGGSSSGAGVSVADGMCVAAIGTDTGGSVRIPSAFCGLTGFKPTARRIPSPGALPLSLSLDSIGPLGVSVNCCAILDAILAGQAYEAPIAPKLSRLRFAIPSSVVLDEADTHVRKIFEDTIDLIRRAGAQVELIDIPEFEELASINSKGGIVCAEAWAWHRELLIERANQYDPRVSSRILRGKEISAADFDQLQHTRLQWIGAVEQRIKHFDALLMPTVPIIAPPIKALATNDTAYFKANALILRNPTLINFLDGCALSIPCHPYDSAPVGLMVAGSKLRDRHILNVGAALEQLLSEVRTQ
ncbi:amidase [Allopusillimonas ginsengisoli]|uniref:amidase n=1 Tax=Allopusillimonas ginsengisoli TaxID=453575 RepID=UPI0010206D2F|nr:amidase [Allopusillimonas ginsengisoli]TEA79608.1 amidase [Allopusillimonas ginsengisoli]